MTTQPHTPQPIGGSRLNAAADGIDRILAAAAEGPHMQTHVKLACAEIGKALHATYAAWTGKSTRLAAQHKVLQTLGDAQVG